MRYLSFLVVFFFISCKNTKTTLTAQQIIDKTIAYSGANKVANSKISFQFRDKNYTAKRTNGTFTLTRSKDSVTDILQNNGFKRLVNTTEVSLDQKATSIHTNAVNSVHYFSVLPFGLNDKAVQKKLLPATTIKGKAYHKVEISFTENGGGEDFEDVFIYWIGADDFLVDYVAYSYHTNGGGKRFRVLKEQCVKGGIRFVDYHNYKPLSKEISLLNIDQAFQNNQLEKVSEIVLKNIEVQLLNE